MNAVHFASDEVTLWHGDCIDVMRELPDESVDSVVTDPPYGIGFMGHEWDQPGEHGPIKAQGKPAPFLARTGRGSAATEAGRYDQSRAAHHVFQAWCEAWASECLRILKPGGHLIAFGAPRAGHRLAAGIEDAGFEIRDSIAWLFGSGFPKSLDVSKAIDRAAGAERQTVGKKTGRAARPQNDIRGGRYGSAPGQAIDTSAITAPATELAERWKGWGTALKPGFEPIVVARKPLAGTVVSNVLAHGTGGLNIDGCRIPMSSDDAAQIGRMGGYGRAGAPAPDGPALMGPAVRTGAQAHDGGRWPANVVLDESQAEVLDDQSGVLTSGKMRAGTVRAVRDGAVYGRLEGDATTRDTPGDSGGASRFFYTAKASNGERPSVDGVQHPTVKPLDLMQWLVRLVTPRGGVVLEPFAGSGTTAEACLREGVRCIAIEREADYLPLIMQRLQKPHDVGFDLGDWQPTPPVDVPKTVPADDLPPLLFHLTGGNS